MIQKLGNGKGFGGLMRYLTAEEKQPEILGGNMLGRDAEELAAEFGDVRRLNLDVEKAVFHSSLSAAPGERLTEEQWVDLAERYIQRMGYENSPWVMVRHGDRPHDHVHIVASRVGYDGKRVQDFQERRRGQEIVRDLEREMGLQQVTPSWEKPKRNTLERGQALRFQRSGEVPPKVAIRAAVDAAAIDRPTVSEFLDRLHSAGVEVIPNLSETGRVSGLAFRLDEVRLKGSSLGRSYSWAGLQRDLGIRYDAERDLPLLRLLARAAAPESERLDQVERHARRAGEAAQLDAETSSIRRQMQTELPPRRSFAEAQYELERLPRSSRVIAEQHPAIYRDPRAAGDAIRQAVDQHGPEVAYTRLESNPQSYGRLRGRHYPALGPNQEMRTALERAGRARRDALAVDVRRGELQRELADIRAWQERMQSLGRQAQAATAARQALGNPADIVARYARDIPAEALQRRGATAAQIAASRALSQQYRQTAQRLGRVLVQVLRGNIARAGITAAIPAASVAAALVPIVERLARSFGRQVLDTGRDYGPDR